eukprot:TRINITY_DN67310_c2_g1_i2.p1 TRINITY_DN67310_c2_g1~~TRINITY_DN67310_c2_g1_i2.p1  ORF type:complete len:345 (+),score=54.66 TRINITY_DN67310_c2_g1_i2:199-1233(+)
MDHMRQRPQQNYSLPQGAEYSAYNPSSPTKQLNHGGYGSPQQSNDDIPMWIIVTAIATSVSLLVMLVVVAIYHEEIGEYFTADVDDEDDEIDYSQCMVEGEECQNNLDCCSRWCIQNTCQCHDIGEVCNRDENCCSGSCMEGRCELDDCKEGGEACSADEDCCSLSCESGTCLSTALDEMDDCVQDGQKCEVDFDCCSFICTNGQCTQCFEKNEQCTRDEECCNERCDLQIQRCKNCEGEGEMCRQDSDCCSGKCFEDSCAFEDFDPEDYHDPGEDVYDTSEIDEEEIPEDWEVHEEHHEDQGEDPEGYPHEGHDATEDTHLDGMEDHDVGDMMGDIEDPEQFQ